MVLKILFYLIESRSFISLKGNKIPESIIENFTTVISAYIYSHCLFLLNNNAYLHQIPKCTKVKQKET